jgi:small-conductance mechanosensitive channel
MEGLLREAALAHPRVLRVPAPIVRFVRLATTGLDFELFVFVSQLADRVIVSNDLNRDILARLIEEKIVDPRPVPELRVRDIDKLAEALRGREAPAIDGEQEGTSHAAASPPG